MFEVSQCALSKFVPCNVRKIGKFVCNTVFISHSFAWITLHCILVLLLPCCELLCFSLRLLSLGAAKSPAEESSSGNRRITSLGLLKDRGQAASV